MLKVISNGLSLSGAASLETRMRKELIELDLFDPNDLQNVIIWKKSGLFLIIFVQDQEDEILEELKLCHEELRRVNEHNVKALHRLLNCATEEMGRQELRRKLHFIDSQVHLCLIIN